MRGPINNKDTNCVRYYSLARYALLDALKLAGVDCGQRVLLPSFICRDLLAPLAIIGASPVWYDIDQELLPLAIPDQWPEAEVVLAINYFGFPQDLAPFVMYSQRTGAKLIEDNAHGYLSRDISGNWLGNRAPFGLFSVRKTLRIPDGAALWVKDVTLESSLTPQLPFDGVGINPAQEFKSRLRDTPVIGGMLLRVATVLARSIREWRTGSKTPQPDPQSELGLPAPPNPWAALLPAMAETDVDMEIARRRAAYLECAQEGGRVGVTPVFPALPENCAPYGYPFRGDEPGSAAMQRVADRLGFDLIKWPDLPTKIVEHAPLYYRNVWVVSFIR
jgi:hypothetical protein